MRKKENRETVAEAVEAPEVPSTDAVKKRPFAFFRKKNKEVVVALDQAKVKEYDGPFQHRVTGKEFNSFVLDTQSAIIKLNQEMLSFTGRVNDIGNNLEDVDTRHKDAAKVTVQMLMHSVDDMQQKVLQQQVEYKKSIRIYQIITAMAVLLTVVSFVILILK